MARVVFEMSDTTFQRLAMEVVERRLTPVELSYAVDLLTESLERGQLRRLLNEAIRIATTPGESL